MNDTSGGLGRWLREVTGRSNYSAHFLRTNQNVGQGGLPPRRLTPTPRGGYGRWLSKLPRAVPLKRLSVAGVVGLLLIATLLGIRLKLSANKIIVRDDGAAALQAEVDPDKLQHEGDGRINVLLIGIGGANHTAGTLSDSIMIASLDPLSRDVTMLSIPRDLYVEIDDYGSNKINAAHAYGEDYNHPGGGPKLLAETISNNLGVPIHYYGRLDFSGFRQAVDSVGGVEMEVKQAINDAAYPDENLSGFEPFSLPAGRHEFDGATALKFARSRYSSDDFDRGSRQQQLLLALKDKALSLGTLINPLKINNLLSAIGDHVRTNIDVNDLVKLAEIGRQVDNSRIQRAILDNSPENYLASRTINNISALVPRSGDFEQLKAYVRYLMPDAYLKREAATVTVLNGTDRPGLADQTAELLRSLGYLVVRVDNAPRTDYDQSVLYDRSGGRKRYTLHYLTKRFNTRHTDPDTNADTNTDITLIVGADGNDQL